MSYKELSHRDLVQACLNADEEAWKEFTDRYKKVIGLAVLRTARRWGNTSKPLLEDLVGDTYAKLCGNSFALLRNFEFRTENAIFGFFKVVATNIVHDHFRRIHNEKHGDEVFIEDVYASPDPPIPSHTATEEIERNVLIKEVEDALWEVTGPEGERDRTIFWLHHRQGFTAEEIAGFEFLHPLSVKGVESALHRLKVAVRERLTDKAAAYVAAQEQEEKGVSPKSSF